MAQHARTPEQKQKLVDAAKSWLKIAADLERAAALGETEHGGAKIVVPLTADAAGKGDGDLH